VSAIRDDFAVSSRTVKKPKAPKAPPASPRPAARAESAIDEETRCAEEYWRTLSAEEQRELEEQSVLNAEGFLARQYHDGKERGGLLFETAKRAIIMAELKRRLASENRTRAVGE
jgi:hypothetical protein